MIVVVLDANTLASGAVALSGSTLAAVINAWVADEYQVQLSNEILKELEDALSNRYFSGRLSPGERTAYLNFVRTSALFTEITAVVQDVATHPEDDLILATAVSAGARYLVTGDIKLQRIASYQGVTIVSPRTFVDEVLRR